MLLQLYAGLDNGMEFEIYVNEYSVPKIQNWLIYRATLLNEDKIRCFACATIADLWWHEQQSCHYHLRFETNCDFVEFVATYNDMGACSKKIRVL